MNPIPVNNHPKYIIYPDGRVFSTIHMIFLKPVLDTKGYHRIQLNRCTHKIHRLVATHFVSNPDNKPEVNHIDGIKTNNHYTNLEWVTTKENKRHAVINGLHTSLKGQYNGNAILTDKAVDEIKQLLSGKKMLGKEIAAKFGVSVSTISAIKTGKLRS